MARSIIAPIVATIFIFIKLVFGIDVPEDVIAQTIDATASGVAVGLVLIGIFKNHQKRPDADK